MFAGWALDQVIGGSRTCFRLFSNKTSGVAGDSLYAGRTRIKNTCKIFSIRAFSLITDRPSSERRSCGRVAQSCICLPSGSQNLFRTPSLRSFDLTSQIDLGRGGYRSPTSPYLGSPSLDANLKNPRILIMSESSNRSARFL